MTSLHVCLVAFVLVSMTRAAEPRYVGSIGTARTAAVVRVENEPLAHTTQLLPVDPNGDIVGKGDTTSQVQKVFENLQLALTAVGSTLDQAVKLNVYLTRAESMPVVEKAIGARFRGKKPAVSWVITSLPHKDAFVAIDAIAVAKPTEKPGVQFGRTKLLAAPEAHGAILPTGAHIYISGQAEKGKNLVEATRATLASLKATLTFLERTDADVVQVKAFLTPMTSVASVYDELKRAFPAGVPPVAFVEWKSTLPIEIEMVVAGGGSRPGPPIEYLTPPGMTASPIYSRVTRINHGPIVYVAGLFGPPNTRAEEEVLGLFAELDRWLGEVGSDFGHMAKATYYVATEETSRKLNEIRPRYYDPKRPPAASKAMVAGTGVPTCGITLDMIAVPALKPPLNPLGPAEFGHGLTQQEALDGWVSLFDGKTTFGWNGAEINAGVLRAGTTTAVFGAGELRGQCRKDGVLRVGPKSHSIKAGTFTVMLMGDPVSLHLAEGLELETLLYRPGRLESLWNGKDLTGWKTIQHPRRKELLGQWIVEKDHLHVRGGPATIEFQNERFADGVIQIVVRTRSRFSNGGLFFRCIPGEFMNGYEVQLYNRCWLSDPARPARYATGAVDDRQNARRLISRDGEPFMMTVLVSGNHIATWVNGYGVADWKDERKADVNPRNGVRLEAGTIQLQAHDTETDYDMLSLRAAAWKR